MKPYARWWRCWFWLLVVVAPFLGAMAGQAEDKYLWVDATVNGKPVRFIFDTGTSDMVLARASAVKLGLKITRAAQDEPLAPGAVRVDWTEECDLALGEFKTRLSFAVFDLPPSLRLAVDGFIGWGRICDNIVKMDIERKTVHFLAEVPKEVAGWTRFTIKKISFNVLVLEASDLPGKPCFLIDTGSEFCIKLHPQKWRDWLAAHPGLPRTVEAYYTPGNGMVVTEEVWAKDYALGSLPLTGVALAQACPAEMAIVGPGYEATLGLAALSRLDIIIDGKKGVAYLQARKTPAPEYKYNHLGAVFSPVDLAHEDLVARVVDGSPAFEAGIRTGDLLLKIDDLDATKWRTDPAVLPLSRFWERPAGTRYKLTVKRGQETLAVDVVLRQILAPEAPPAPSAN